MRTRLVLLAAVLALSACGTSSSPTAPAPAPSPALPPPAPPSATPSAPPSGSGAVPPAGSASESLLEVITAARGHKVRMTIDTTRGDTPVRPSRTVLEVVPPDRRHATMDMPPDARTRRVETILIGNRGWMRMDEGTWGATPQPTVAVGLAGADSMIDQMASDIASGRVQVTLDSSAGGMRAYHITVPDGVMLTGGSWDGHLYVGGNDLPVRMEGTLTGGAHGSSTVHETFDYDDTLTIEPPL